ncbi:MAG TPA: hypothetical protein VJ783_22175 [Pirellulales bacterium]|nr:hypothetical protein [Pirellulales bacterium]
MIAGGWLKEFARMTQVINRGVRRTGGKCDGRRWSLRQTLGSVTLFCVAFAILSSLWRFASQTSTVGFSAVAITVTLFWIVFTAALLNLFRRSLICWGILGMMSFLMFLWIMGVGITRLIGVET